MKTLKLPKVLVLNYDEWVCGYPSSNPNRDNCNGLGNAKLLNYDGYKCCLDQFSEQAGCKINTFQYYPAALEEHITRLNKKVKFDYGIQLRDTKLSTDAAAINDDTQTSIAEKVVKLRRLFGKIKRTIELKNFPTKIINEIKMLEG